MSDINFNLFRCKGVEGVEAAVIVASATPSTADVMKAAYQAANAQSYFLNQHGQLWMTEKFLGPLHILFMANEELNDQDLSSLFSSLPPETFPVPSQDTLQA
jgi:hypothetical protein